MNIVKMNLLKDGVLGLLGEVVLVGDVDDRLQGGAADERLLRVLEHPEAQCFKQDSQEGGLGN